MASIQTTSNNAALILALAIAETIRETGPVPSGYIYAGLMNNVPTITLESYENILAALINAQLVSRNASHLLTWTGPMLEKAVN